MKPEDLQKALQLLFDQFWIIREDQLEDYQFLRRHQNELQKELRQRFGMSLIVRPQYIQLLKRPHTLEAWMGDIGLKEQLDYVLFACVMAYVESLESETPFMLDELIRNLDMLFPEEIDVDWTNYNHRTSIVRVLKKLEQLHLIEKIQGEMVAFEQSNENQELLFVTTAQSRALLSRAPMAYTEYSSFEEYWQDICASRNLEVNQMLYQRLMMEPMLKRGTENEELFVRLRNYHHYMRDFVENNLFFSYELYRDYAAFTTEKREGSGENFPSRQVVDEILIQVATLVRQAELDHLAYGISEMTSEEWQLLLKDLQETYQSYWSKEFKEMSEKQLSQAILRRGSDWGLFEATPEKVKIYPALGRLIAEMRLEDE
ncbi:TIGR02678 family protein [Enterococcus olivae]